MAQSDSLEITSITYVDRKGNTFYISSYRLSFNPGNSTLDPSGSVKEEKAYEMKITTEQFDDLCVVVRNAIFSKSPRWSTSEQEKWSYLIVLPTNDSYLFGTNTEQNKNITAAIALITGK